MMELLQDKCLTRIQVESHLMLGAITRYVSNTHREGIVRLEMLYYMIHCVQG